MNSIIEVKDVTFTYSGAQRHSLERVSLAVAEGEFVGVIGPSGAGQVDSGRALCRVRCRSTSRASCTGRAWSMAKIHARLP